MTMVLDGTNGETFPSWTTSTRPSSPAVGQMGYNTTTGNFDAYTANGWVTILPSASGSTTQLAASSMPTASVIQIVQGSVSGRQSIASSSFTSAGLSASITPQFNTSKILALVNLVACYSVAAGRFAYYTLYRGSTNLATGSGLNQNFGVLYSASADVYATQSFQFLDSPATTSPTTYSIYAASNSGSTITFNQDQQISTITLMEIR